MENSPYKNGGLGNLWPRLGILEAFLLSPKSLSISLFFCVCVGGGGGGGGGGAGGGGGCLAPQNVGFLYRRI